MVEVERCQVVTTFGGPMIVKHSRSCTSDYCPADYEADKANRAMRHRAEMDLEK